MENLEKMEKMIPIYEKKGMNLQKDCYISIAYKIVVGIMSYIWDFKSETQHISNEKTIILHC